MGVQGLLLLSGVELDHSDSDTGVDRWLEYPFERCTANVVSRALNP